MGVKAQNKIGAPIIKMIFTFISIEVFLTF